jgi:multidrug resistance efflux pump
MEAQINVDENDIVSVALGQEAEITVDALPDQH